MPIPRHLKHPIALWIIDGRKEHVPPMKPGDVARVLDVTEATVRAWETARAGQTTRLPSPDNLDAMARLFGRPAPGREPEPAADQAAIVAAIDRLTAAVERQTEQLGGGMEALGAALGVVLHRLGGLPAQTPREPDEPQSTLAGQ